MSDSKLPLADRLDEAHNAIQNIWGGDDEFPASAAALLRQQHEALKYLVAESDPDMDDDYNPHAAPLSIARAAIAAAEGEQS